MRLRADTLMETLVAGLIIMSVLLAGFAVFGQIGRNVASYCLYTEMRVCRDSLVATLEAGNSSSVAKASFERKWGTLSYERINNDERSGDSLTVPLVKVICRLRTGRNYTLYYDIKEDETEK